MHLNKHICATIIFVYAFSFIFPTWIKFLPNPDKNYSIYIYTRSTFTCHSPLIITKMCLMYSLPCYKRELRQLTERHMNKGLNIKYILKRAKPSETMINEINSLPLTLTHFPLYRETSTHSNHLLQLLYCLTFPCNNSMKLLLCPLFRQKKTRDSELTILLKGTQTVNLQVRTKHGSSSARLHVPQSTPYCSPN